MKKIITALMLVLVVGVVFVGCSKGNATWLQDGKTLVVVDNTLGEGEKHNAKFTHTYKNSVVTEDNGYVYILPVSESNPKVRYFISISQGASSASTRFLEITGVKNNAKIDGGKLTKTLGTLRDEGLTYIDGETSSAATDTVTHYSSVVSTTKYCYYVTKNNNLTVWGEKYLAITVTSPIFSASPISFTVEIKDYYKLPLLLGHKGDSWKIV